MNKALLVLLTWVGLSTACVKDRPFSRSSALPQNSRILLANEGVFGNGNATLSLIDPNNQYMANQVPIQGNVFLGDVFQSIAKDDRHYYFVINNSSKIIVVDTGTFQFSGLIDVPQPRYMAIYGDKAFVSALYHHAVFVVDLVNRRITDTIPTESRNNEGLLLDGDRVFVCPWDTASNFIYEVDANDPTIVQKIGIAGTAPQQVVRDKNGLLWVLAGNKAMGINASITQIDPGTKSIVRSFDLGDVEIIKPAFNPTKDTLYYIGVDYSGSNNYNGIFRMSIYANEYPKTPFVPAQTLQYYWSLGIDHRTGLIYVGDPKGFLQSGSVQVYDQQGSLQSSYQSGLGPSFFLFD